MLSFKPTFSLSFFMFIKRLFSSSSLSTSTDTSTTDQYFCFIPVTSFFLEKLVIALHSFPVAYCTFSDLRGAHLLVSFLPNHTVHGVLVEKYLSSFPLPPPVDHVLSDPSAWVALYSMVRSFVELSKPLCHGKPVIQEEDKNTRFHQ